MPLKLAIGPSQRVISCIVYLGGVKPKGDKKRYAPPAGAEPQGEPR